MNTDDYEGHTPGPWDFADFEPIIVAAEDYEHNEVDWKLIAAAPDLLAEVKRLRKQVQAAHEWVQDYFDNPVRGGLANSFFADWIEYMKWEGNGGLKE